MFTCVYVFGKFLCSLKLVGIAYVYFNETPCLEGKNNGSFCFASGKLLTSCFVFTWLSLEKCLLWANGWALALAFQGMLQAGLWGQPCSACIRVALLGPCPSLCSWCCPGSEPKMMHLCLRASNAASLWCTSEYTYLKVQTSFFFFFPLHYELGRKKPVKMGTFSCNPEGVLQIVSWFRNNFKYIFGECSEQLLHYREFPLL